MKSPVQASGPSVYRRRHWRTPPRNRAFLDRLTHISRELRANAYPNCSTLAKRLEASPKTIQRDIAYLRDRQNWPIEWNAAKRGYYLTGKVEELPTLTVTEGELVGLIVAEKALHELRGTVFENALHAALDKLAKGLRKNVSVTLEEIESAVSIRGLGISREELTSFRCVHQAITQKRELHFHYRKPTDRIPTPRRIHPYHIACIQNLWYLVGRDLDRDGLRTFALPRMSKPKMTRVRFERPADFSADAYFGGSFGAFTGSEEHTVRLRFDAWAAPFVRERQWHKSQKLKDLPGGGLEVAFRLRALQEIQSWILGWGGHVRVLAPKQLANAVRTAAQETLAQYPEKISPNQK